jgi:hypothetical protein
LSGELKTQRRPINVLLLVDLDPFLKLFIFPEVSIELQNDLLVIIDLLTNDNSILEPVRYKRLSLQKTNRLIFESQSQNLIHKLKIQILILQKIFFLSLKQFNFITFDNFDFHYKFLTSGFSSHFHQRFLELNKNLLLWIPMVNISSHSEPLKPIIVIVKDVKTAQ